MSYVVVGRREELMRVASRASVEAALAEACRMGRDGFAGLSVKAEFQPSTDADVFAGLHPRAASQVCPSCPATCPDRDAD